MARAKRKADYYVKPIYNQSDIYKRFLEVIVYNKIPLDFFEKLTIKDCYLYFSRCNYLEAHIDVNYNAQCDREVLHTYVDYETRYDSSGHSERVPVTRFYTEHVPFSISGTYDYRLWSVGGVDDITKPEMIPLDEDYPICEIEDFYKKSREIAIENIRKTARYKAKKDAQDSLRYDESIKSFTASTYIESFDADYVIDVPFFYLTFNYGRNVYNNDINSYNTNNFKLDEYPVVESYDAKLEEEMENSKNTFGKQLAYSVIFFLLYLVFGLGCGSVYFIYGYNPICIGFFICTFLSIIHFVDFCIACTHKSKLKKLLKTFNDYYLNQKMVAAASFGEKLVVEVFKDVEKVYEDVDIFEVKSLHFGYIIKANWAAAFINFLIMLCMLIGMAVHLGAID